MDELSQIRELYGRPDQDPFVKTRVEARVRMASRRRLLLLPWQVTVAGLAAAAVVAAVVVPGMVTSRPVPVPSPEISTTTLSGHSILLAAAAKAEAAPEGAYWHVKRLYRMRWAKPFGKEGDTYRLEDSRIVEDWVAKDGRGWSGFKQLAARPLDMDAWRRDGSPTEWGTGEEQGGGFSTSPGEGRLVPHKGEQKFRLSAAELTLEEIEALPADPEALKDQAVEAVRADEDFEGSVDDSLPTVLASLLYELPTSPQVRGAAFRALAELPSVKVAGEATDPQGRPGVVLAFPIQRGQPTQGKLIVDPETSMVLAFEVIGMPGKGDRTEVVLESGWTDSEPVAPSL
ncbi:hypothetical protein GCM10022226_23870 [Sphaerisporangium flaviroseum]|uniref:CU044_5270 family protein n=1 Tax=Sphaerisporangium flaviroseum TaxID=509199 RepID=A0ABP7HSE4_9ACTN